MATAATHTGDHGDKDGADDQTLGGKDAFFDKGEREYDLVQEAYIEEQVGEDDPLAAPKDAMVSPFEYLTLFVRTVTNIRLWIRLVLLMSVITLTLVSSLAVYAGFYWYYIPKIYHTLPVDFQFGSFPHHQHTLPFAKVVLARDNLNEELLDCLTVRWHRLLSPQQAYDFNLVLTMPESPANDRLGNFMVESVFSLCTNETLCTARQPYLLPYRSLLFKLLLFTKRLIPFYLGWGKEAYSVTIPLTRKHVIDQDNKPLATLLITISNPNIQIYDATLCIDAKFSGLKYLMYHWFTTSAIIATVTLFIVAMLAWLLLWLVYLK